MQIFLVMFYGFQSVIKSNGLKIQWGCDTSTANKYKTCTASLITTSSQWSCVKYEPGYYAQQTNLGIKKISETQISVDSGVGSGTKSPIWWICIGY